MEERYRMGDTLRRMSKRNRATFLRTVVKQLDSGDAQYLLELVQQKLAVDPLRELPVELQYKVLLLVEDPVALLRMARACRYWNSLILEYGDRLWRKIVRRMSLSSIARECTLPLQAVKLETQLQRNWQRGDFHWKSLSMGGVGGVITCLHIDEHGGRLISGADNGSVRVWRLGGEDNRVVERHLTGHQGGVWASAVDGDTLVTGSTDRTLIVWDVASGERLHDLIGHSSTVRCVEIVNGFIVSGSRDGTVRVWDRNDGRCLQVLTGHTGSVRCLAVCGDGLVVSGSYDATLRIWNICDGRCVAVCSGHDGKVYSVAATSEYIFSGGIDAKIRVWRCRDGELVDVFGEHSALVGLLQVKSQILAAASTDGSLSLWDCRSLSRIRHIELAHRASITALAMNRYTVMSGSERSLQLWSIADIQADEPAESILLSDKMEVVWKVEVGEVYAAVAYQQAGITRIDVCNFSPPTLSLSREGRGQA